MEPWQSTALKVAASALLLAIVLPLIGFAFARDAAMMRGLRVGAIVLSVAALIAGVAVLVGWVWS